MTLDMQKKIVLSEIAGKAERQALLYTGYARLLWNNTLRKPLGLTEKILGVGNLTLSNIF